ncbi:hypothetical protein PAMP_022327 [Pampus punctatissimus]
MLTGSSLLWTSLESVQISQISCLKVERGCWLRETANNAQHLLCSHTHFLPVEEAAVPACPLIPSLCRQAGELWTHGTCQTLLLYHCSCNGHTRKWDWLTTTLIMPGTTAPTWPSPIAVGLPYFQSSSLGMKEWPYLFPNMNDIDVLHLLFNCLRLNVRGQDQHIRYEHIYLPDPSSQSEVEYEMKRPRLEMGPESLMRPSSHRPQLPLGGAEDIAKERGSSMGKLEPISPVSPVHMDPDLDLVPARFSKEELIQNMDRVDREITMVEQQICKLRKKQAVKQNQYVIRQASSE